MHQHIARAFLLGTLAFGSGRAIAADAAATATASKCKITDEKDDNDVTRACKLGGVKRAKAVMKAMTKAAKEKGKKWECDSCHKNEDDYALTADGKKQFKEMLDLLKEAK